MLLTILIVQVKKIQNINTQFNCKL